MNSTCFEYHDKVKRDTYESLKKEYDEIKEDISSIKMMEISDEAKQLPLKELEKQINEIKERMHNFIDTL